MSRERIIYIGALSLLIIINVFAFSQWGNMTLTLPRLIFYHNKVSAPSANHNSTSKRYLINTNGCKIPFTDPFDQTIMKFVRRCRPADKVLKCSLKPLTYGDRPYIRINRTALRLHYGDDLDKCEYQTIHRPRPEDKSDYFYFSQKKEFIDDVRISDEFFRVICHGKKKRNMYLNFHAFIIRKPEVDKKSRENLDTVDKSVNGKKTDMMNVVFIGLDSTSRSNYIRNMGRTRSFINKEFGAIELHGYNKVGDNTFFNTIPILSGRYARELNWSDAKRFQPFDGYDFIWKNFSKRGYKTLFAEDTAAGAIFNFKKTGFFQQPTDYYLHPYSYGLEVSGNFWNNGRRCAGAKPHSEITLDYLTDFLAEFKSEPHFAFIFNTNLTHDVIHNACQGDNSYLKFFKNAKNKNLLENSAVFFFSDHGYRYGALRRTHTGKLEERLVIVSIMLPKWFHEKYPEKITTLKRNRLRLTTNFDIHATLDHILDISRDNDIPQPQNTNKRGVSLFHDISEERSCQSADINIHWCACHDETPVSLTDPVIKRAVDRSVSELNRLLKPVNDKCEVLRLEKIRKAAKLNTQRNTATEVYYQLEFSTLPGKALFESTVNFNEKKQSMVVSGAISRVNRYGNQSNCINDFVLQKYCFCK